MIPEEKRCINEDSVEVQKSAALVFAFVKTKAVPAAGSLPTQEHPERYVLRSSENDARLGDGLTVEGRRAKPGVFDSFYF